MCALDNARSPKALESMRESLLGATSMAALQGIESRSNRLLATFDTERQAFVPRLERFVKDEPARLLTSCDDVRRLCKVRTCGLLGNRSFIKH